MVQPAAGAHFRLLDRRGRLASVRLQQDVGLAGRLDLTRADGVWALDVARPDVDRLEYLFEIVDHNHHRSTVLDPANPRRAGGAFGDKSVLEFPEYRPPQWLDVEPAPGAQTEHRVVVDNFAISFTMWTPVSLAAREPAPLLVVHDGPEFAALGGLTHYLGALIRTGRLPAMRAALLDPGERNAWYAANSGYARALRDAVVPVLDELAPSTRRIGLGASLGALAMLHGHRANPGFVDALFLQSGSFFTPEFDPQESDFSGFAAVTAFTQEVLDADPDFAPVPTVLTCGTVEENLANNRAMTAALQRLGYPAELVLVRDAHNYTAWRDALHPHLTRLITGLVRDHAA